MSWWMAWVDSSESGVGVVEGFGDGGRFAELLIGGVDSGKGTFVKEVLLQLVFDLFFVTVFLGSPKLDFPTFCGRWGCGYAASAN